MKTFLLLFALLYSTSFIAQNYWNGLPSAPLSESRYDDVFFLNDNTGWAVNGSEGKVLKTTDGGSTWEIQFVVPNSYFRNIEFLNNDIGFLGTLDGQFYRSDDGGANWNLVTINPNPQAICGLDAVGSSTIYGCGAFFTPAYIIKSDDNGLTWIYTDMSAHANASVEIIFVDELLGYASGGNVSGGVVLKTTDGGVTWTEIYNSQVPGDLVWKLQLLENNTHIYGTIQSNVSGKLLKSSDSGLSWETKSFFDPFIQALGFITPDHGWVGGHNSGFFETTDGGETWTPVFTGQNLNRIFIISPNLAYASGHTLYKYSELVSLEEMSEESAKKLEVKIAPNPISDKLNLSINFMHTDNLVVELYDMNGRLLQTLVIDKISQAQTKDYSFDFPYASGTYSVNIHTNNGRRSQLIIKN